MSTTTSCRVPDSVATQLAQAADERQLLQSEIMRQALRYYIAENPYGYAAFAPESRQTRRPFNPEEDLY